MALLKCPECGHDISSNAKACPNCGAEICICPDCGTAYVGKQRECAKCGYLFEKKNDIQSEIDDAQDATSVKEKWFARANEDKNTIKNLKYWGYAIKVLEAIPVLAFIIVYITWTRKTPEERLFTVNNVIDDIKICCIVSSITIVLFGILDFVKRPIVEKRFADWLLRNKLDMTDYIKQHSDEINTDNDEITDDMMLIVRGNYIAKNPDVKNKFYAWLSAKVVLLIALAIISFYCGFENIKIIIGFNMLQQKLDFAKLDYVLIGINVAFVIADGVFDSIWDKKCSSPLAEFRDKTTKDEEE